MAGTEPPLPRLGGLAKNVSRSRTGALWLTPVPRIRTAVEMPSARKWRGSVSASRSHASAGRPGRHVTSSVPCAPDGTRLAQRHSAASHESALCRGPRGQCMTHETQLPEESVAIIGMSGRFPGAASIEELWHLVLEGQDGAQRYTDGELAAAGVPEGLLKDPRYVKTGFPLEGFDLFDSEFFGITPAEAELTDPQQRLFLETAWQALERSGHSRSRHDRTGVFAGASTNAYLLERIAESGQTRQVSDDLQVALGNDPAMLALRVSYKLGLTGPSITVQTACSSSLVAVHLAAQSLLTRECDLALSGGVAVRTFEPRGHLYEDGAILSADGRCCPFDAAATGSVPGNGVAVVVLKRLEDALVDGDHIHAVIRGSAVNNDGAAKAGFTAPSPRGQTAAIAEAMAVAGVFPNTVAYVEAHGTATELGDPIEIQALKEAFGPDVLPGTVHVGSVKSNVGHLDAAAGVTGLIKAVLALEHGVIPPTAHFRTANPRLSLDTTPFRVDAEPTAWPVIGHPPRAGVSAFGVGGTNAHVVLEAAPASECPGAAAPDDWHVLPVSARTPQALATTATDLAETLDSTASASADLGDVAYTLQCGRTVFPHRQVVVANHRSNAAAGLRRPAGAPAVAAPEQAPAVVFLFPGQGSQYEGMGRQLYQAEPIFRAAFDRCAGLLLPHLGRDIRDVVLGSGEEAKERLRQTLHTQPAVFSLDYALAQLLLSWGVHPTAMTGHSIGELVSACLAGVFSLEGALRVVAGRAQLMQDLEPGRMLSVPLDEASLTALLNGRGTVAAVNAPASCVVGGTLQQMAEVQAELAARGIAVRELETSHAFHTPLVEPALPGLAEVLQEIPLGKPDIPFLSNVTGTWITDEQATDPAYWVAHARQPVRFSDGVSALGELGPAVLVEVGPGSQLSGLVRVRQESTPVVGLLRRPRERDSEHECRTVREGLGELWRLGVPVDWQALHPSGTRRRVSLPVSSLQRRRHLLPRPSRTPGTAGRRDPARWTYAPVWHLTPPPSPAASMDQLSWLVLADDHGLADELIGRLRAEGHTVTTVYAASAYTRPSDDTFTADPADPGHLFRVIDELRSSESLPQRVLHAWGITVGAPDGQDGALRYALALDAGFHSLVSLVQALDESGDTPAVRVDVLTNDLRDAQGTPVIAPERATVYGAVTVLPQEYPWLTCRSVDVTLPRAGAHRSRLVPKLLGELTSPQADTVVAYRGAQRLRCAFAPVALEPVSRAQAWPQGGYLVTGACGEAGLAFAEELASASARLHLAVSPDFPAPETWQDWMSGATGDDEGVRDRIRRLTALRVGRSKDIVYTTTDITDADALTCLVAGAREHLGSLRGVLHCADHRSSGLAALKSRDDFAGVLAARVKSTLLLDELLRADDLDFFLISSAITGIVGGFGQLENAASAAFADAFAHAGAATGRRTLVVDWAQWEWDDWFERQMSGLPNVRDTYERLRRQRGIPVAEGVAIARAALTGGPPQVVVSTVDFQDVLAEQAELTASSFTDSLGASRPGSTGSDWDPATVWPDDELAQSVARVWNDMLGVSPIGPDDDFYELGGNSLFAIQIVSRLRQECGDFPMSTVFEAPTVDALAAAIRAHQAEAMGLDKFEALLREVESLSAEEAEARLKDGDV
ncbi:beta-ketoacyl synthase N-terminal-like domain-containing protein [Streptomyces sp. NPDC093097]|uniref:type I polyketide synthase n=1 Tax=Streptomyces sp. NPDC093097 TaxID=3366027 RepID=UPI00382847C2